MERGGESGVGRGTLMLVFVIWSLTVYEYRRVFKGVLHPIKRTRLKGRMERLVGTFECFVGTMNHQHVLVLVFLFDHRTGGGCRFSEGKCGTELGRRGRSSRTSIW